eukprot:Skav231199  [mRNA]  locus=scaffold2432:52011:52529:+ [translate_table: standard]
MACSFPWLSILIPRWISGPEGECRECHGAWVLRDITNWLSLPAALLLQVHVGFHLGKLGAKLQNWLHIFALTKVQTMISILIWLPVPLSLALTSCCNLLPCALIIGLLGANIYLYLVPDLGRKHSTDDPLPDEGDDVVLEVRDHEIGSGSTISLDDLATIRNGDDTSSVFSL